MEEKHEEITMEEVLKSIDESRSKIGSIVKGTIVHKVEDGLVIDFKGKYEGFVSVRELVRSIDEYETGEELDLQLVRIDEDEGRAYLSERRPLEGEVLEKIEKAFEDSKIVKGKIVGEVKGGYRVLIGGVIEAFLPGSQSLIKRGQKIPEEELEFEILTFERRRRRTNIVLSRKSIVERKKREFLSSMKEGDVVKGRVESIMNFGVFVSLGEGVTGLIPKSEVSHSRVPDLKDMFELGQEVEAKVIALDVENDRITLSLKALLPDPFEEFLKNKDVGTQVSGEVSKIRADGFTVKLDDGVWGFVPIEEIFWSRRGRIRDVVKEGDRVDLEIVGIDKPSRRIVLSYKKAKGNPWDSVEERYPIGSVHEGRVVKVLQGGAIVELEDGVAGFVPLSELSWNYFEKVDDVVRERRRVKVKVLSVDKENKRMRLSIKQTQENPWDKVIRELDRGSVVRGKVRKVINSGYIVRLSEYGIDAFLPTTHVEEELKPGSEVEAVVLRVLDDRKTGKRMIISVKDLEEMKALREYKKEVEESKKTKTLGDLLKKEKGNG